MNIQSVANAAPTVEKLGDTAFENGRQSNLAPSSFKDFWQLGYERLCPVVPPNAALSQTSSLAKRKDARGKAVGVCGRDGLWHGIDWVSYEADESDLKRWSAMGAGIGVKTGKQAAGYLIAVDADTLVDDRAETIRSVVLKHLGELPTRIGRYPKALYLCRVSEPLRYTRVEFGELDEKGRLKDRVEILSEGRQFVAQGIHPVTGKGYYWLRDIMPYEQLPIFPAASVLHMLEELRRLLPAARPLITEGASTEVDQAALRGDPALIRRAVEAIPNTSKHFPTRESHRDMGYAIKAALTDYPDEAFEIFSAWSARWEEGDNDPDYVEAEWRRYKPPFRRGAGWLYELAEQHAPSKFSKAEVWFQPIDEKASPFEHQIEANPLSPIIIEPTPYSFPDPASIPRRQWVYGDHYIRSFVSATVAPGGLGKSSLTIAEALAMASGRPLLGVVPCGQFRVWMWNGEDPPDELNRRIAATISHYGLTAADIGDRLLVDSGMNMEIVLAKESRTGAVIVEPVADALISALRRKQIDVFIADPFVSSHKVTENDNVAIDLVVKRWAKIAFATSASIELVHHVRKTNGAEVTVEDARGASALANGARSVRALTRMTDAEGRSLGISEPWRFFRSGGVSKNNLAPAAGAPASKANWFTMHSEPLGNGTGEGAAAFIGGDAVGVVMRSTMPKTADAFTSNETDQALSLIGQGDWRADVRAGDAWVGWPVAKALNLDASDKDDRTRINGILKQWRLEGRIEIIGRTDKSRHLRQFVRLVAGSMENVFS